LLAPLEVQFGPLDEARDLISRYTVGQFAIVGHKQHVERARAALAVVTKEYEDACTEHEVCDHCPWR
jgi:hypothetical protein